jgi:PAS domain S-box-containing protein
LYHHMDQVLEFFRKLFDVADWPPRWHCGNWTEFHGWLYIISDLLIWSAYFAIPLVILKYISKRTGGRFIRAYFLFAAFILACGSTHLLDAITFWFPAYRLNALVKFFTGLVSWITVFYLIRILPIASSLRPYEELEKEINERKRIEEELKLANEQLLIAQEIAKIGHWQWDIPSNRVNWSAELFKIYGLAPQGDGLSYEAFLERVHPDDREMMSQNISEAMNTKVLEARTHRIILDDGSEKTLQARGEVIADEEGNVIKMIGTGQDITEQEKSQQQLLERTRDLEMTNAELKKFAYVASHDLQEPLRKILTFSSLLEKELPESGEKVDMYMGKISAAAGRMQRLIEDILKFSSIKADPEAFKKIYLHDIIEQVVSDLEVPIADSGATVRSDTFPVIEAIPSQMGQLFQNLITNALKFRKENVPLVITITSEILSPRQFREVSSRLEKEAGFVSNILYWDRDSFLKIEVKDNGIGFEEKFKSKIFEIFQRLHNGGYTGTGIGLAICKKITDNHHGIIRAESKPGQGAIFTIFLPLTQQRFLPKEKVS